MTTEPNVPKKSAAGRARLRAKRNVRRAFMDPRPRPRKGRRKTKR